MMLLKNVVFTIENGIKIISSTCVEVDQKTIMYAKGAGGTTTQHLHQNVDPWSAQAPFLKEVMTQAQKNYWSVPSYIPFSSQTEQALQRGEQRATAGSPVTRAMQSQLQGTLGGDYLYGGPGFNKAVEAAQRQVLPQVQSQFARGGRTGSGLAAAAQTKALSDAFASQYAKERQNQMRAMLFAPQAAQADYGDIAQLAAVGSQREGLTYAQQMDPQVRLARYHQLVAGPYGSATSGTQAVPRGGGFSGAGALGGALGGAKLGAALGAGGAASGAAAGSMFGPPGMAIGAIGGGLLGGFL